MSNDFKRTSSGISWKSSKSFELGGEIFSLGYSQGISELSLDREDWVILKERSFLIRYVAIGKADHILELGLFQGGSFVFLDRLFKPKKIAAVEMVQRENPRLERYVQDNSDRARIFCPVSQDDASALEKIAIEHFGGSLDLVIDDASHWYEQTKSSFLTLYPFVKPGGTYIIEDWGWSFHQEFQSQEAPWRDQRSLANLIFEIVEEVGTGGHIADITVTRDMVLIRKPNRAIYGGLLSGSARRGRSFTDL
jgi:hypothetical protein